MKNCRKSISDENLNIFKSLFGTYFLTLTENMGLYVIKRRRNTVKPQEAGWPKNKHS
jgi:hypothetical protein